MPRDPYEYAYIGMTPSIIIPVVDLQGSALCVHGIEWQGLCVCVYVYECVCVCVSSGRLPRSVSVTGNSEYGYTITIVFDPVATPGDVPALTVTNAQVTGTNVLM